MPNNISRWEDKGLIIDEAAIADGTTEYSNNIINTQNINVLILHIKTNQDSTLLIKKLFKNSSGTVVEGQADTITNTLVDTGSEYKTKTITTQNTALAVQGYGFKIGIQNDSGGAAATVEVYLQMKA